MSEQNIVNVMVIPDVPKVLPGEQLYVYVPKASFTFPGIIAYNNTQFRIDGNFLFIREDYVSPGVQQKIDELKQYTDDELQLKQDKEDNNISLAQRPEQKSVVGAINDLGTLTQEAKNAADHAQTTADNATTLANTGISKAEQAQQTADNAQQDADAAQATADNATTLANTGISKAEQAQSTANTAVDKANDAKATAQEAIMKADGRSNSIGFMTAKDAVTALNGYPRTQLKGGDTIWIVETGTPDLWVTEVAQESVPYNYTTKDKFNQDLVDNKVLQIGYFKTAYQESDGKPVTIAWQNVLVKSTDWVASTEFADFPYEAKIELTDFVDYTTVPQVVFDIADTMSGNYAPICKSGDKCVYIYGKVQNEITLKTVITFAPNVNGASVTGGGYNNRGKWVASTTYEIDDLVYTDNGQYVCIEGITSTTSPEQDTTHWQATFVATGKTKNGLKFSGQDTDGSAVQKTFDGSVAVEVSFDETTMTAKEVDGVLKVGAKGTIPEALPQTAGALKSGNLPTTGWGVSSSLWTGSKVMPYNPGYVGNIGKTWASSSDELEELPNGWQATMNGTLYSNRTARLDSDSSTRGIQFGITGTGVGADEAFVRIYTNGDIYVWNNKSSETRTITQIGCSLLSKQIYTISDTDITANSDVLMELTDEGGVKSYSMEVGSITVIRDTVPTQVITYTYKVKQTNASGQFTLINHYGENTMAASLQKASVLKSGNLPTGGWSTSAAKELFYGNLNFAGYSGSAIDNGKILPPYNYTSKKSTSDWTGTQIRGKNISYCQQKTDGDGIKYISLYFESGYGINSHKEAEIRIYDDGTVKAWHYSDNSYWETVKIVSTFLSDYIYTISDTDITANSDVLMELTDDGETKSYSIKSGKITVIRSKVPTYPIPYTYKVKQTNASGQFTLVNHFVPTAPVTSVNGQTGAVTIAVPTKTSELENDSGYVRNVPPVVQDVVCNDVDSAATLDTTITCEIGDLILAQIIVRSALTLPTDWTLLRTIPAVETKFNQTLSFAYKRATSTSETLTVTEATAGRIYTNLVRLSNAASISYIQSCENTGTNIASISSTKPVTPNMVIWGASNTMWNNPSPYGDWTYAPSTLDYYSLPQTTRAPRLGTFIDSSGAGERTFTPSISDANGNAMMCGAVEVVGDEVARKGDIPTKTSELTNDSGFITASDIPTIPTKTSQLENDSNFAKTNTPNSWGSTQTFTAYDGIKTNRICNAAGTSLVDGTGTTNKFGNVNTPTIIRTSEARPKAEVPYADGTAKREIALLEDIPSMVIDWVGPSATEQVITGTGMRQIFAEFTDTVGDVSTLYKFYGEVYVDGQNEVNGTSSTVYSTNTDGTELHVITVTPTIRRNTDNQFVLRAECCRYTIGASPMSINKSYLSFVYRKRLY